MINKTRFMRIVKKRFRKESNMKLIDQVWLVIRKKHYSYYRPEKTYVAWIKRFIYYPKKDTLKKRERNKFQELFRTLKLIVALQSANKIRLQTPLFYL